ncbi:MAG: type II toxin-antitoxin system VapC family toxin [Candidatus Sulfotelmatobacter sp.]
MNRVVLDTSALLAILQGEPGGEVFARQAELLENSMMSAVNVAEAHGKLVGVGIESEDAWEAVTASVPEIVDFDKEQAKIAGGLLPRTRPLGLSLGDRACLALGMALKVPIYTADRAWKNLKVKVSIHIIR